MFRVRGGKGNMMRGLVFAVVGAAAGGAIGYFGSCSSGTCPLTSTWWGGALYGGLFGFLIGQTL
ncbi:MAG: hypothetical protein D4R65_12875 [Verrucomicrobiaceae bacterium]|nr:MAG: hypothetical protein D4R65_12875 [Verrucomicrobiaceae bacterium]